MNGKFFTFIILYVVQKCDCLSSEILEVDSVNREPHMGADEPQLIVSRGCPADHLLPCVPKCCDLNASYEFSSVCTPSPDYFFPEFADCPNLTHYYQEIPLENRYEYFIGDPCLKKKFMLDVLQYPDDKHHLYSNGTLWYADSLYTMEEFCVESVNGTPRVFLCFGSEKFAGFKFILYPVCLLISIPFLILTAVVYLGFERLRDIQGKALACHVLCLAIAYFFLALVQLASQELNKEVCIVAAFIIQFFFVACFVWLNVLCFDTWRNICFDKRNSFAESNKKWERNLFIIYSLYGWYAPGVLTLVSLVMDLEPTIPESYLKPRFGFHSCWFQSEAAALPYFYGPVMLLICINVVFFVMSARKIYSERKHYIKLKRTSNQADNYVSSTPGKIKIYIRALKQCVSLFCVMGINWAAEVISWIIGGSDLIWLVTDIFNTLQGLIIFYIFILKPLHVRNEVFKKVRQFCCIFEKCRKGKASNIYYRPEKKDEERRSAFNYSTETNIRFIDASVTSLNSFK